MSSAPHPAFSVDLSIGHAITHRVDLGVQIIAATFPASDSMRFTSTYVGASMQYWWGEHTWIRFGQGIVFAAALSSENSARWSDLGIGLELGAGYAIDADLNVPVSFSVELVPGLFPLPPRGGASELVAAVLIGISLP